MAILEEGVGGNVITMAALVAGVVLVRRTGPELPPNLRSLLESGLKLFAEAEFEARDGLISKLAETTVQALLQTMPDGKPEGSANEAAQRIVGRYEQNARASSQRHGWHERDSRARYRHQMRKLKSSVAQASRELPPAQQAWLSQLGAGISEDW